MRTNKMNDVVLLDSILTKLENRNSSCKSSFSSTEIEASSNESTNTKPCAATATTAETQPHIELFGKIIQQIVKTESTFETWGLYARWSRIKGDLTLCSEALLKQVRSYQVSEVWKDEERFKKFAKASLKLCRVYMEISVSMEISIKQARKSFAETEELKELESFLEEVRNVMQKSEETTNIKT